MKLTLTGVAAAIMMNISAIAGLNDPQLKITPVGFLKMLLENNAMTEVNNLSDIRGGQKRSIEIKYMQRGIESEVSSVDDCDTPITAAWKTTSIGEPLFSKIGIFISDEDMRKYVTAATNPQALGNSAQAVSKALYETVLTYINALLQKIDGNLVAAQALKFGVNAAYASADAQSIALGTKAKMDDGVVKLVLDAEANEVYDELLICGNGLVRAFDVYNKRIQTRKPLPAGVQTISAYLRRVLLDSLIARKTLVYTQVSRAVRSSSNYRCRFRCLTARFCRLHSIAN